MKLQNQRFKIAKNIFLLLFITTFSACGQSSKNDLKKEKMENTFQKTDSEWRNSLSEEQYYILRQKGTERPFTGKLLLNKDKGTYKCAGCGNELFTSDMKFDSHCGWPSFDREIKGGKIKTISDRTHGMTRTEILCAKCDGHLGHIFDDGPTETGKRYCVNSVSIEFTPEKDSTSNN